MHLFGKLTRVVQIRRRCFPPQEIGVTGEGEASMHTMCKAAARLQAVEAFAGSFAGDELAIALVDVGGNELGAFRVGAGHHDRRRAADVGRKPRRDEVAFVRRGRDQNLTAEVTALLLRGQLVLEMNARSTRLDECLHDLEGVKRSAEPGLGVGHDRREPVALGATFGVLDLVGAGQRAIDAATQLGSGVRRVQTLVRIDLARGVGIGSNLPAGKINRPEPGTNHLHRLIAGHGPETGNVRLGMQQLPQAIGTAFCESVPDLK
jgi:hypothetical protein